MFLSCKQLSRLYFAMVLGSYDLDSLPVSQQLNLSSYCLALRLGTFFPHTVGSSLYLLDLPGIMTGLEVSGISQRLGSS